MWERKNVHARIHLQKNDLMKDGQGGFEESWQQVDERWASIEPSLMKSLPYALRAGLKAGTLESMETVFCVVMRDVPALPVFERFIWQGRFFRLLSPKAYPISKGKVAFYAMEIFG